MAYKIVWEEAQVTLFLHMHKSLKDYVKVYTQDQCKKVPPSIKMIAFWLFHTIKMSEIALGIKKQIHMTYMMYFVSFVGSEKAIEIFGSSAIDM